MIKHRVTLLTCASLTVAAMCSALSHAQTSPLEHGAVSHDASGVTILAIEARPLRQAVAALREEYGWMVDYEDPIYTSRDLVDATDAEWRKEHPTEKGVNKPAGHEFQYHINAPFVLQGPPSQPELAPYKELIAAYNLAGQPGQFTVLQDSPQRLDVIGSNSESEGGILGFRISLPTEERTVGAALDAICSQISLKSGKRVRIGFASANLLVRYNVVLGGTNVPGRALFAEALNATHRALVWEALYDYDMDIYVINVLPALQTFHSASGETLQVFVKIK